MQDVVAHSFAALDRIRTEQAHASSYQSYLPVSKQPLGEYATTVLTANALFVEACIASRVRYYLEDNHVCTAGCARFQHGDAYVCRRRGNLHYCDATRCDERRDYSMNAASRSISMYSETTCVFTGKGFGNVFQNEEEDEDEFNDARDGTAEQFTIERPKPPKAPKPPKPAAGAPKPRRVRSRTGVKGRKLTKKTIERKESNPALVSGARNYLLNMLSRCKKPIPDKTVDRFVNTAVLLWSKVGSSADKLYRALKYRFEYHCYVVMYYLQEGLTLGDLLLFPKDEFLEENLPDMDDLDEFGINTNWHTKHTRQFLFTINKLDENAQRNLCMNVMKAWGVP